ncbi:hypothetical protein ACOMHN_017347 [Nucella lapillus]
MAAEDIQIRMCLQDIVKLELEAKAFIQDIREIDIRDEYATEDLEDYASLAREKINKLQGKVDDLSRLGHEQDRTLDREAILTNVTNFQNSLNGTVKLLRQANLSTQLKIDELAKKQLLNRRVKCKAQINKKTLAKKTGDITESLMTINSTMESQVLHSRAAVTTLANSSSSVGELHEGFREMGAHINSSHRLLTKYGRRQITDNLVFILAFVFFFGTVLYILKKRLWPSS